MQNKKPLATTLTIYLPTDDEFEDLSAQAEKLIGNIKLPSNLALRNTAKALAHIALCPRIMEDVYFAAEIRIFKRLFVHSPDETLKILARLRKMAADGKRKELRRQQREFNSKAGRIRVFFVTTKFLAKKNGRLIAVEKLTRDDYQSDNRTLKSNVKKIPIQELQDGEIAQYLTTKTQDVTAADVKMARPTVSTKAYPANLFVSPAKTTT